MQTDIMVRFVCCMQCSVHIILKSCVLWQQTTKEWIIQCWNGSLWLHAKPLRNFSHNMQTHTITHCTQLRTLLIHHLSLHVKLEHNINNSQYWKHRVFLKQLKCHPFFILTILRTVPHHLRHIKAYNWGQLSLDIITSAFILRFCAMWRRVVWYL